MSSSFERSISNEDVLESPRVKEFLDIRKIKEEDHGLVKDIIELGDRYDFGHYHNFFNSYKDHCMSYLDRRAQKLEDLLGERSDEDYQKISFNLEQEFIEKFKEFLDKYDFIAAHHLLRLVEGKRYKEHR